ncbi:hypothetical protein D3C81_1944410 [compost metagenome]
MIALDRLFSGECGFDGADVAQINPPCGVDEGRFAGEPERFVGKVCREDNRLRVIEHAGGR